VSTTTIEEQLADVRRRIEQAQAEDGMPRLQRHLDLVDEVEQKLAQLKTRLDVAERSLAADASGDWATYAAAVEAELESWDTYLERLQTTVATRAWHAREQAETAIGEVRTRRLAVDELLAQAPVHNGGWQEQKERVSEARDALEQKADELSAKLN
jgi:chromosome segregation ATPase